MKKTLILLALLLASASSVAFALTPAQVRDSYYGCMKFLKLSPAKQVEVASRVPYTLKQIKWACQLQKKKGLASMLRAERDYQRSLEEERNPAPAPSEPDNSCNRSGACGFNKQCINHQCQDINPPFRQCDTANWCAAGEQCQDGVCR
jgi:hypothetical protein